MAQNIFKSSANFDPYELGDLSLFPERLDTLEELHVVANRVTTTLVSSMSPFSELVFLEEIPAAGLPSCGVVRINYEFIFYGGIDGTVLTNLIRGFGNSEQSEHRQGSKVELVIRADDHNVLRDATFQLENKTGLRSAAPNRDGNLSERAAFLRAKWWTPRALWFARPTSGPAPLEVQFCNFSRGFPDSFHWSFGDGTSLSGSEEARHPIHVYEQPGSYNVSLSIFTKRGGSNRAYKIAQIKVLDADDFNNPSVWVETFAPAQRVWVPGSRGRLPLHVRFIDQTQGIVNRRVWTFGDGESQVVEGAYEHEIEHVYQDSGSYQASLFLQLADERTINFRLPFTIEVVS